MPEDVSIYKDFPVFAFTPQGSGGTMLDNISRKAADSVEELRNTKAGLDDSGRQTSTVFLENLTVHSVIHGDVFKVDSINQIIQAEYTIVLRQMSALNALTINSGDYLEIYGPTSVSISSDGPVDLSSNGSHVSLSSPVIIGGLTGAPSSPVEGSIYYNSTDKHFYGWNGTSWKQLDN